MEWEGPGIVLDVRPYGEGDAVATVFTEAQGTHRGLARGGGARARVAIWQEGNLVQVRWAGRLTDQLGSFSAELVHASAALAMADRLRLAMLRALCAVAAGALPEREPHPRVFRSLLRLVAHLSEGKALLPELARWEMALLAELGYGLDLGACAVTGGTEGLAYVSPRTGRAVSEAGAGEWRARLLPLPQFLRADAPDAPETAPAEWEAGLRLTGHFLRRVFALRHHPLPAAREALYDLVVNMNEEGGDA